VPPETAVASIGGVAFDDWAYPARVRVVAEIISENNRQRTGDLEQFWQLNQEDRERILKLMHSIGAQLVVCNEVPLGASTVGWTKIPDSRYLYRFLGLNPN
jgi:hypothetical protein